MKITFTRNIELSPDEEYTFKRFKAMLHEWENQTNYTALGDFPEFVTECLDSVERLEENFEETTEEW